jgi:hypothetical protein
MVEGKDQFRLPTLSEAVAIGGSRGIYALDYDAKRHRL